MQEETTMQRFVLISAAALLISVAPAALAQNGTNPTGPHASATKPTTAMAKTRVKARHAGNHVKATTGASHNAVFDPQNTDEGRSSGGGSSGGGGM
jgi:uncharacterized membrane protein YgcG